jgi:hypothetical protein
MKMAHKKFVIPLQYGRVLYADEKGVEREAFAGDIVQMDEKQAAQLGAELAPAPPKARDEKQDDKK